MIQRLDIKESKLTPTDVYVRPNQPHTDWFVPLDHRDEPILLQKPPLRKLRLQIVIACLAFTIGGLFIVLNSPYRDEFLAPGPLTQHHAQLLTAEGSGRCSACHAAGSGSFSDWLTDLLAGGTTFPTEQVTLCLNCHRSQIDQALAKLPHTMPADKLAELTTKHREQWQTASTWLLASGGKRDQLACAVCHREHHGTHFNLTAMTDGQCQTCHVQSFAKFETDHPPFSWERPTSSHIAFDHRSHAGKHFEKHQRTFDCQLCHQTDGSAMVMQTKPFEESCASCHRQAIEEPLQSGIAWFRLPAIDVTAFRAAGIDIGVWPAELSQGFDGVLTPYMKRLLASDAQVAEAMEQLGTKFHFEDLEDIGQDKLVHAAVVIHGIKRLLWELANRGPQAAQERLAAVNSNSTAILPMDRLFPFLNELLFRDAVTRWLPELALEMESGKTLGQNRINWFPDDMDWLARTSPDKQDDILVPNPLAGKLDGSTPLVMPNLPEHPQTPARPQSSASLSVPLQSDENQTHWKNGLRTADVNSSRGVTGVGSNEPSSTHQGDSITGLAADQQLLRDNPLNRLADPNSGILPSANIAQHDNRKDSVGNLDSQRSNSDASPNSQNANHSELEPATESSSIVNSPPSLKFSTVAHTKTGWFRDDQRFQLTYYPVGHADPLISSWTELAVRDKPINPTSHSALLASLDELTLPTSAGQCATCHQVNSSLVLTNPFNSEIAATALNKSHRGWQSNLRSPQDRGFTKFNHAPHLLLQDCRSCHQLDLASESTALQSTVTKTFQQFLPIERAQCASCHRENQAPNRCTTCHHYHIGELPSQPKTPLEAIPQ